MPAFDSATTSVKHAGKTIALDHAQGDLCFVSHAHSDHSSHISKANSVIASPETVELCRVRQARNNSEIDAISQAEGISLHDAGHVLGARQICVEGDGGKFVYTGDFNSVPSLTCPAAQPVECDVLVVESTYGSPEYAFPERGDVYKRISAWVSEGLEKGENVVLGGYSLGKAQELVKVVNELVGSAPIVNYSIAGVSRVYDKFGCRLDFVEMGSYEAERMLKQNFVAILPMNSVTPQLSYSLKDFYGRPARTAVATGWALDNAYAGIDEAFPLSDHSDYAHLLEFIEQTGAKKVFCTHGFGHELAAGLRKKGIDAAPLKSAKPPSAGWQAKPTKTLLEYST